MTSPAQTRSLVLEREMPQPVENIWQALTRSEMISEWLMNNDFQPIVGHRFNLRADPAPNWNGVTDCQVLAVEPLERLAYSWSATGDEAAKAPKTVVTWTLAPAGTGTRVRMEQSGFPLDQDYFYQGATYGWNRFMAGLERVVAELSGQTAKP